MPAHQRGLRISATTRDRSSGTCAAAVCWATDAHANRNAATMQTAMSVQTKELPVRRRFR